MTKSLLYVVAATVWGVPGVMILYKGIMAFMEQSKGDLWWLMLIAVGVLVGFFFIFRRVVSKYSLHIVSLPERAAVWHTFPLRGWVLIVFMMGLGMVMKFIEPPTQFIASFYSALGLMLIWSAIKFLLRIR